MAKHTPGPSRGVGWHAAAAPCHQVAAGRPHLRILGAIRVALWLVNDAKPDPRVLAQGTDKPAHSGTLTGASLEGRAGWGHTGSS